MTTIHKNTDRKIDFSKHAPKNGSDIPESINKHETTLQRVHRIQSELDESESMGGLISLSDEKYDKIVEDAMREDAECEEMDICEEEYKSNVLDQVRF